MNNRTATLRPVPKDAKARKLKKVAPPKVVKARGGGGGGRFGLGGDGGGEPEAKAAAHAVLARLLTEGGDDGSL